jgi:hypothetical protein
MNSTIKQLFTGVHKPSNSGDDDSQDSENGDSQNNGDDDPQDGRDDASQDGGDDVLQDGGDDVLQDGRNDVLQDGRKDALQGGGDDTLQDGDSEGEHEPSFAPQQGLAKPQTQPDSWVERSSLEPIDIPTTSVSETGTLSAPPSSSCVEH